ncbi:MAG TPA: hypothetical protein VKB09_10530 [Thermomicrobiales bacterium]|nr:hypothetical protein [Thermomicrobiales bacterium]
MLSELTLRYAEELTEALLGLDAIYAAERGKQASGAEVDMDRLVVLNLSDHHRAKAFSGYPDARARFEELKRQSAELPEPDRALYYAQTCGSAIAFATWCEEGLPFKRQISEFLHIPARPASESELDGLRASMREMLVELGYHGDLGAQMAAWEDRQRVPADEVEGVLNEILSEAWDLTAGRMEIPAEKSDGMRVETVSAVPYNAMCDYSRRLIRLNIDPTLTRPGLRHLAVHEGYPGHYVQFKRREVRYREGLAPADVLLSVINTASSPSFEGIADVGLNVIGWHSEPDDRLAAFLTRYRAGLGTRAAWRLHAEDASQETVRDELLRDSLVGGEGWVDARMRYITGQTRSALIWSYWAGKPGVHPVWKRVKDRPELRGAYFSYVYDRMHSNDSIAMFREMDA